MSVVVDASTVVAALVDTGPDGRWAETILGHPSLCAPELLYVEVANVLRRAVIAGELSADVASLAHADLLNLRIEFFSYETCAQRVWDLRENLTAYDAWYVAVAELIDAPLMTLDERLAHAPGSRCTFLLPQR